MLRIRICTKFGISWVSGSGFRIWISIREENEETSFSEKLTFSPEDSRLLMELVFIKLLDLDPVPDSDSTKKDGSGSGFIDTRLATLVEKIWSVPLFMLISFILYLT